MIDNKQTENIIWHIEINRETLGDAIILNQILESLKRSLKED